MTGTLKGLLNRVKNFVIWQLVVIFNLQTPLIISIAFISHTLTQKHWAMQRYSLQKHLGPFTIDKALIQRIEIWINRNIPRILLLNLEKGKDNPLSPFISVTIQKQYPFS